MRPFRAESTTGMLTSSAQVCYWWEIAERDGAHEVGVNTRNMDPEALKHVDWKISNSWLIQPVQDKATAHRDDKACY
jgi:hypothetical protein